MKVYDSLAFPVAMALLLTCLSATAQPPRSLDDELLEGLRSEPLDEVDRELFDPQPGQGRAGEPKPNVYRTWWGHFQICYTASRRSANAFRNRTPNQGRNPRANSMTAIAVHREVRGEPATGQSRLVCR